MKHYKDAVEPVEKHVKTVCDICRRETEQYYWERDDDYYHLYPKMRMTEHECYHGEETERYEIDICPECFMWVIQNTDKIKTIMDMTD